MPGKIPEGWENYEPMGKPIPGTRLLAVKVPLEEGICNRVEPKKRFTPAILMEKMEHQGHDLGLIVDLTNTKRYYKPFEFTSQGIEYYKLFTEGRVIPGKKVRTEFFEVIDNYLKENADNNKLIIVHCTHGLNRTGYMVCRYMIDRLDFSPEDAITTFNKARGYDMERENYLEDIRTGKSHEASDYEEPVEIPKMNSIVEFSRKVKTDEPSEPRARESRKRPALDDTHRPSKRSANGEDRHNGYERRPDSYSGGYERRYNPNGYSNGPYGNGPASWGHPNDEYGDNPPRMEQAQFGHGSYWEHHGYPARDWDRPRPYSRPQDSYSQRPRGYHSRGGHRSRGSSYQHNRRAWEER